MNLPTLRAGVALVASTLVSANAAAQSYPARSIRLIVPFVAAGTTDTTSRIMAQALTASLGQQVVVDNRPGATGRIGTELVAKAPPDGYTLLFGSAGPNVIVPGAYSKLPYDAVKDFAPISLVGYSDHILIVHPSVPVRSVKDLIALARTRPGQLTYSSAGTLSVAHMSGELFAQLAKVRLSHIAYKGGGQAVVATFSGEVSMYFGGAPTVVRYKDSGKVRFIATTGAKRMKALPDVPTISETLPGYEVTQWLGMLAPASTPSEIIARLHAEIVKAVANPKTASQLEDVGADPHTTSPQEFAAYIRREIDKWRKVVKAAGIVLE
jgi:tripartite-type tricarboxylate transporter receptor subunit TctC